MTNRTQIEPASLDERPRAGGRRANELRPLRITRHFTAHAEGSVLIEAGQTRVLCTASVEESVPLFLKGKGQGWLTAEYGMLPRATNTRTRREAAEGKQSGRTQEIQRLIGRSLRAVLDMAALGERTIRIDCDVLQADGGTRTAAITGGFVALSEACEQLVRWRLIDARPMRSPGVARDADSRASRCATGSRPFPSASSPERRSSTSITPRIPAATPI